MKPRPLGTTGISVSPIGLGTVKLGRTAGLKHPLPPPGAGAGAGAGRGPGVFELPTDSAAAALLDRAAELGVNLIDTAPAYGVSEERLGRLISPGKRGRWVICTKAGEEFDGATSTFAFSAAHVRMSIERSLKRLRTDVIDIALLHSDGDDEYVIRESGGLEALRDLQSRGLVRAVGASTKTPEGALLAVETCDVVMLTLNVRETADAPAIKAAAERGVGVLVKKGLASGHIGAPASGGAGDDPVAGAVRFVLTEPGVSSLVIGTVNPDHLAQAVAAAG